MKPQGTGGAGDRATGGGEWRIRERARAKYLAGQREIVESLQSAQDRETEALRRMYESQ